ncbi:RICIN domain-containing protein [Paenibacillus sp. M.A.Huq-81]
MSNRIGNKMLFILVMAALLLSLFPPALAKKAAAQSYKIKYVTEWTNGEIVTNYDREYPDNSGGTLKAITISLGPGISLPPGAYLEYRIYAQREGWYPWVAGGQRAHSVVPMHAITAIEMRLINAPNIQVRYLTDIEWGSGYKQDGETAGRIPSTGYDGYSIEVFIADINVLPTVAALFNPQSGKALDVQGAGTADGARLIIWDFFNFSNQRWRLQYVDHNGYYKLIDSNSNKAIDVYGVSTANGAIIHIWTPYNTDSQLWKPVNLNDGTYKFINKLSGKALDVKNGGTANLTPVHLWEDNGSGAQKWRLIPV